MTDLQDRRLLVTGASGGLGAAVARRATAAGARVAVLARSVDRLEALAEELGATAIPADVTDAEEVAAAVDRAAEALGGLDGVVNNAGVARPGRVADADPADWRLMFDVNVLGLLHVTQAALPHLRRADHADIVNVSSMSGRRTSSVPMLVYAGTKFAVHAISEGLRKELDDDEIRVSVISPGYIRTGIFSPMEGSDLGDHYEERMNDMGLDPDAVAAQIVHVLGAPPDVEVVEVALTSMRQ